MGLETSFARNVMTCHGCRWREAGCQGRCACGRDGRDIVEHAREHDCPAELFEQRGLGDWVARVFLISGAGRLFEFGRQMFLLMRAAGGVVEATECGCRARRERLNRWRPFGGR